MSLKGACGHFRTITRHRHKVLQHCIKAGIPWRGMVHDLSKFSPAEFIPGAKYYQGNRSPNERERELFGHSAAWMHHKGRNLHHYEYWNDFNPSTRKLLPVKMPPVYVIEMFCDRVAASKIYKGADYNDRCPLEYFNRGNARPFMHPETADFLEKLLTMLAEDGEKPTFAYIKSYIKSNTDY